MSTRTPHRGNGLPGTHTRYRVWVQRRDLTDRLPAQFADLLDGVQQLADPTLAGHPGGRTWDRATLAWT